MKEGQYVFVSYGGKAKLFTRVMEVTEDGLELYVINGAYTLSMEVSELPAHTNDYNAILSWFNNGKEPN